MKDYLHILNYEKQRLSNKNDLEPFLEGHLSISFFLIDLFEEKAWLDKMTAQLLNVESNVGLSYALFLKELSIKDQSMIKEKLKQLSLVNNRFSHRFLKGRDNYQISAEILAHNSKPLFFQGSLIKLAKEISHKDGQNQNTSFISNLTHEIKNPLNAILGYSQLLAQSQLNSEQESFTADIITASSHLKVIVNDILDYSKIEAGKMVINQEPFSIENLMSDVRSMVIEQAKQKNIYFDVLNINCPKTMIGDENRIRQILINFASNAVKFTEIGGVSLTSFVDYDISSSQLSITFAVKDTGIGMTKLEIAKMFVPFEQANKEISPLYGGTGLGLSISNKLAVLMNGEIIVKSKVNEGCEISISIPLTYDKFLHKEEVNENIKPKTGSKILLVEDNKMNQKLTARILENQGMVVTVADNGQIAVDLYQSHPFDLIFMDFQMPVLDGVSATRLIRETNSTIPIIALTSDSMFEDLNMCKSVGMNDYIIKPVDPKKLYSVLVKWIPVQ